MMNLFSISASLALLSIQSTLPSCVAFSGVPSTTTHASSSTSTAIFAAQSNEKNNGVNMEAASSSRRSFLASSVTATSSVAFAALIMGVTPVEAEAAADCFSDCLKNCKLIAPKDPQYCQSNCKDYCDQPDRTDGLSGSVSSTGGETGILGTNTVVKGEDKPPQVKLPGLDFSSEKGKKLIGY